MRLDALREVVRTAGAEARANAVASLAGEDAVRLYPALVALLLVEPSLRVRGAIEEALRRRPPADEAERPAPPATLSERERSALAAALAHERAFLELMLASPRGRDLLLTIPLAEVPLDDHLVALCLVTDARVVNDVLALPFEAAGRSATLIAAFDALEPDAREAVLGALVWNALHAARTMAAAEVTRARAAVALWVQGLLEARAQDAPATELPDFAAFVAAGGSLGRGPVTATHELPGAETVAALGELARALKLTLDPADAARRDPTALLALAVSPYAELRALGWRLLLRDGHATPAEALEALQGETAPGVIVEVLRALPAGLSPGLGPRVCALLGHRLASVRRAAVDVLAQNPLLAALAATALDPRAADAPFEVFAALPEGPRAGALSAWLETPRAPEATVRALGLLTPAAPSTWPAWPTLLRHEGPRVRAAARAALVRLPVAEGEAALRLLEASAAQAEDPLAWARALERFAPVGPGSTRTAQLVLLLLDELVHDAVAEVAVRALARRADSTARAALWTFVVGSAPAGARPRRFGSRAARERALEALLALPASTDSQAPAVDPTVASVAPDLAPTLALAHHLQPAAFALRLLDDRDPWQVRLGLRLVEERGASDEVRAAISTRLRAALGRARESRRWRGLRVGWARLLRSLVARGWVGPGGVRGARRLLPALLDAGARHGHTGLWADDVRPLLADADAALRGAAARLYVTLPGALPLRELTRVAGPEVVREALRVGHPLQVEVVVLEQLARGRAGDAPLGDVGAWIAARPRPRFVAPVARFLDDPAARAGAVEALAALHRTPDARVAVEAVARDEVTRAVASRDDDALVAAVGLVRRLALWELVPPLLPGVAWAREGARAEVVAALREAKEHGLVPAKDELAPLLRHGLWEVRTLALSLLRAGGPDGLWDAVRPAGPTPGRTLPTDFAKPFLGACEDAWEEGMGLAVEALLAHSSGEVARRALKLLSRREREVSTLALLERVEDPELRQPVLTAFSTWAARYLAPAPAGTSEPARRELLEATRRDLRATLEALATAPRARVAPLLDAALTSAVPSERAAALFAIGRLGLVERQADLRGALASGDPVLARCAAWACGALAGAPGLEGADVDSLAGPLEALLRAREPEVRASARRALVRRLPATTPGPLEAALTDPDPEVRLAVLDAVVDRPDALAALTLEARLGDPDPRVRERVLAALARRASAPGAAEGKRLQAHALRGPLGDPQPEVRLAALDAVRAAGLADALAQEVGDALADPSIHVSGAAIDALKVVLGEGPPPAGDAEDDVDTVEDAPAPVADAPAEDDAPISYGLEEGEEDPDEDGAGGARG